MPKKYKDIYHALISNSKWNGDCLETTYKVKSNKKTPQITYKNKLIGVHRASWEYQKGKIPEGLFVCHHCDNPKCFRIEHLFLGTPSDNMKDMVKKRRDNIFGARKYSNELHDYAFQMRKLGKTYREISEILNMKLQAVSASILRRIKKETCQIKD